MKLPQKLSEAEALREKLLQKTVLLHKMADYPSQVRSLALQIKEMLK